MYEGQRLHNPFMTRGRIIARGEAPPQFKAMGLKPVKGGRWSVRKIRDGRWRAWTVGRAKRHARTFYTFDVAVRWAHHVTAMYTKDVPADLRDKELQYKSHQLKKFDLLHYVNNCGGVVSESAINRIIGDSRKGLGLDLARQSSINEALRDQKSRRSLR